MAKIKIFGLILGLVFGVLLANLPPPLGLTIKAMWGMGIIICAVTWLIFDVIPDYIVTIAMCSA